ncbi:MAG: hypothetical protein JNM98_06025 [Rhodocyclaceae bacterium]|nr:hypothetical protein [Rhodocyclaceae bacterium]
MANAKRFRGQLMIGLYMANAAAIAYAGLGNATKCDLAHAIQSDKVPNMMDISGGSADIYDEVTDVTLDLTLTELTPANIARAVQGLSTLVAADLAVVAEEHQASPGSFMPFDFLADLAVPPVLKKGATTFVAGTDYTVSEHGVDWLAPAGLVAGDDVTVDYTRANQTLIHALTNAGAFYALMLRGHDQVTGAPVMVRFNRVKLPPAATLGLLSDKFGTLNLKLTLLADPAVSGVGLSKFYSLLI